MQDVKTARLLRFNTVLDALEKKGGDPGEYRTYASAVSGIKITSGDAEARVSAVSGWLKSKEGGVKWAYGALQFVVILIVFWIIATVAARVTLRITERHLKWSALLERFINKLVRRAIMLVGLLVALSTVGVNVGAMLALIGGGAFIIGFALQDTLGNFAAGLMLLIYRPFDVGDFVETAGIMGKVDNVSLVSTSIRTPDNKLILIPNKSVWGQVITNATASPERRVDMVFGISYDDDLAKAQQILEDVIAKHDKVLADPAPVVKVNELADSSVNFICRPWSKTADYWDVFWDVTRRVKEEFDAHGISIPYPQQDVHVHQVPAPRE
jgi:small conductance mechanosensitive channel